MPDQDTDERLLSGRRSRKEREILAVASRHFLEHGYRGASINAMARAAGISKESFYRYFNGKKALFEAVIEKELAEYRERLEFLDVEAGSPGLEESLESAAESILSAVMSDRTLALRRLIFQEVERTPGVGAYYYDIGPREAYRYLEKIFKRHARRTTFAPDRLARNFVALVLHDQMLRRECGVSKPLSRRQIRTHAGEVAAEFLQAFFR